MTFRQLLQHNVLIVRTLYRQSHARVLLVSFPKSGRTWLRTMVGKVLCDQCSEPDSRIMRTYELTRRAGLPLTEVTHDGSAIEDGNAYYQLSTDKKKYATKKVIFLTRDVRDVLVSSYFHATKRARLYRGTISDFARHDRYGVRKILTFNQIWHRNQHVPSELMVVRYEDLHRDPAQVLVSVLEFMGLAHVEQPTVERAVQFAAFANMRKREAAGTFKQGILRPGHSDDDESYKMRKGIIGGYPSYLSDDDVQYVERLIQEIGQPLQHVPSLVPRSQWDTATALAQ